MSRLRSTSALALLVALLALPACSPPSNAPKAYGAVSEANFVEGCTGIVTTSGTAEDPSTSVVIDNGANQDVCKCQYNWFVANVPFDQKAADEAGTPDKVDFQQLNQQLQDKPDSMPEEYQSGLKSACGSSTIGGGENLTPTTRPAQPTDSVDETTSSTTP
jgi:hypothetical protein